MNNRVALFQAVVLMGFAAVLALLLPCPDAYSQNCKDKGGGC